MDLNNFLNKELERYKKLYQNEKDQLEEFQQYSKELELEMDLELSLLKNKKVDLEEKNCNLKTELENTKNKYKNERDEFIITENILRDKLSVAENYCLELKQKLRKIEQNNDDLERRERIHEQELIDFASRYEKCLERCAYLEAEIYSNNLNKEDNSFLNNDIFTINKLNNIKSNSTCSLPIKEAINSSPNMQAIECLSSSLKMEFFNFGADRSLTNSFFPSKSYQISKKDKRTPSEIIFNLFQKIEEVEKQVDLTKYIIRRNPNTKE